MEAAFSFKYGTIYREVLRLPKFEVCEILNNTVKDNILLHHIKQALSSGSFFDQASCPYTVRSWFILLIEFNSDSFF